jgi:hypothetical protein
VVLTPQRTAQDIVSPLSFLIHFCNNEESIMSVEGKWTLTVKSPVGPQVSTLELKNVDGVLKGTQSDKNSSNEIGDARLDGSNISWTNQVTAPMKIKVEFTATVDGNQMSGKVKAGIMGAFPFTAVKDA